MGHTGTCLLHSWVVECGLVALGSSDKDVLK